MIAERKRLSFSEFCDRLIDDGAYIGPDHHIHRKDGRLLSRPSPNGYYVVRKMYDAQAYHFMEHRVVWYFVHGPFDESLVINHKDFDRTNNDIRNLELITQKQNVHHAADNGHKGGQNGPDHWRSYLTEEEVQAIRMLRKDGWTRENIANLFGLQNVNFVSRVCTGARYGCVKDAVDIIAVYPAIVKHTIPKDLSHEERLKNAALGMAGEAGEVVDLVKKYFYQGHELDINKVLEELGDVAYYTCLMCLELGIDFPQICYNNMEKLLKRYPDGFDQSRSINRKEDIENDT